MCPRQPAPNRTARWRTRKTAITVTLIAWTALIVAFMPVPGWLIATAAIIAGLAMGAWSILELRWLRRQRLTFLAMAAEIQAAGGIDAMDPERLNFWMRRMEALGFSDNDYWHSKGSRTTE